MLYISTRFIYSPNSFIIIFSRAQPPRSRRVVDQVDDLAAGAGERRDQDVLVVRLVVALARNVQLARRSRYSAAAAAVAALEVLLAVSVAVGSVHHLRRAGGRRAKRDADARAGGARVARSRPTRSKIHLTQADE